MNITQLYDDIYSLCMMAILDNSIKVSASELWAFQAKCQSFLNSHMRQLQSPTIEERFCNDCFGEKEETLSEAIIRAYHSVLFADTLPDEERYFLEKQSCELLKWSEDISSYQSLHTISSGFVKNQDIRLADFEFTFIQLRDLLQTHISDVFLLEKLNAVLQNLETKCLRCNVQFPGLR